MTDCRARLGSRLPTGPRQRDYSNSQEPVHGDDQGDILSGQAHGTQHDHHGHQAGLGHPGSSDAGGCGRDTVAKTHQCERT